MTSDPSPQDVRQQKPKTARARSWETGRATFKLMAQHKCAEGWVQRESVDTLSCGVHDQTALNSLQFDFLNVSGLHFPCRKELLSDTIPTPLSNAFSLSQSTVRELP